MHRSLVQISHGNTKLGAAANVSTMPIRDCNACAGCCSAGGRQCYARLLCARFPEVRRNWWHNSEAARDNPRAFMADIVQQLGAMPPSYFRWFVGGDSPSVAFMRQAVELADMLPATRFLMFSKQYSQVARVLRERSQPRNLSLVVSAWPGTRLDNPHGLPVAWVRHPKNPDNRIPSANVFDCPGRCEDCGRCWGLAQAGVDVAFHLHR